jgi:outer membrane lipoprotein SlyB
MYHGVNCLVICLRKDEGQYVVIQQEDADSFLNVRIFL